jgi:hypothetical protein
VSGTVTNSVTGEPILRAHVTVHCASADAQHQDQQSYGALTNAKGEFTVAPLPPGNCWLRAERVGFVEAGTSFAIKSGDHKDDVKLKLIPTGAITGRVSNAAGEPMQHVEVSAEMGNNNGSNSNTVTDDKGQFRIGGLPPGKYRVKAKADNMLFPPEIRSDGTVELRDATTYYPASLGAKMAQRVEVKAGAEASGVDIKLVQTPVVQVSGKVTGIPPGMKGVMVNAAPSGTGAMVKPDGTFVMWRIDPGKYTLRAQHFGGAQLMSAPMEIEVTTANVEHLELRMMAPFEVTGQLRFDDEQARQTPKPPTRPDGTAAPAPPPQPRRVELRSLQRDANQLQGLVAVDDTFALARVPPDRYRAVLNWGSGYVKSVRAGNTGTDGDIVDLRNGAAGPVTLTVSSNFSEISGTVSDSNGPASEATVVIASAQDGADFRVTHSDTKGAYKFQVGPGKYKLAVFGKGDTSGPMVWADLDDDQTETVELSAGDKVAKDLVLRK